MDAAGQAPVHRFDLWTSARKMFRTIWDSEASKWSRLDISARELRLPTGSFGTLLLLFIAFCSCMCWRFEVSFPAIVLLAVPLSIVGVFPALFVDVPLWRRLAYLIVAPVVGATTLASYIPATVRGLLLPVEFEPTGSRQSTTNTLRIHVVTWGFSVAMSLFLLTGGYIAGNLTLLAFGISIGLCLVFCATEKVWPLILATAVFWGLLLTLAFQSMATGSVPLDHVLPLITLSIAIE